MKQIHCKTHLLFFLISLRVFFLLLVFFYYIRFVSFLIEEIGNEEGLRSINH